MVKLTSRRVVLALDGGGLKGIIEARILAEFEKKTGKKCHELFDMVVGTSTGGLVACGLTNNRVSYNRPFTAQELVEFFRDNSTKIFPPMSKFQTWVRLAFGSKYTEKVTKQGIETLLKENFGDALLSQAKKPLIVTAVDIAEEGIFLFKSSKVGLGKYHEHYIRDVCRATSAAPTYFPPALIKSVDKSSLGDRACFALIDGGLAANHPVTVAYEEARKLFGDGEIKIISIGTGEGGEARKPYPKDPKEIAEKIKKDNEKAYAAYEPTKHRTAVGWISSLFTLMFGGQSTKDEYIVKRLENTIPGQVNYSRLQVYFGDVKIEMDDASKIPQLDQMIDDFLKKGGNGQIDGLIKECWPN